MIDLTYIAPSPPPKLWPRFAWYIWVRGLSDMEVAEALGCHPESVRRYSRPFDDERRREPPAPLRRLIHIWSAGEVPEDGWGVAVEVIARQPERAVA